MPRRTASSKIAEASDWHRLTVLWLILRLPRLSAAFLREKGPEEVRDVQGESEVSQVRTAYRNDAPRSSM
jgi:hypothetical protein